jgi:NSS family neurotransmitter:Na+ symporter
VAFQKVLGKKGRIGWIFPFVPLGLNMYYLVVVSWTLAYTCFSLYSGDAFMANPVGFFEGFTNNRWAIFGWTILTLIIVAIVCLKGIQKGVEKFCKFCIPLHYIILFALLIRVMTLPGIEEGLMMFAKPDMGMLLDPSLWARAAGMALFAVGLGPAALMAYGSYLPEKSDIPMDFLTVAWWNLFGCIISGLVVVPAVVAFGLDLQSGPSLTYVTLPFIFDQMPLSGLIAFLFFFAMLLGGLSAAIGILENTVTTFSGGLGWSRKKTLAVVFVVTVLGSIPCIWSEAFLAKFDFIIGDLGYTLTASIMAITLAWIVGAKKVREEWLTPGSSIHLGQWFDVIYKYIVVPLLLFLFVQSLLNIPKIFF